MQSVMNIYRELLEYFGPQHWWPGDSRFEVIVGAILTQQASWTNVEVAIANLKNANMLDARKIAVASKGTIEELIRPSGFYRQKTGYLMSFCRYLVERYDTDLDALFSGSLSDIREELLALRGIGPETCDSILLYAGKKLTFVVDAYTIRVCQRMGLFTSDRYDEVKGFFENNVEPDAQIYNEFHALFVVLGKNYCKAGNPECMNCPLTPVCDHGQISDKGQEPPGLQGEF